jgi:hypothetical protein
MISIFDQIRLQQYLQDLICDSRRPEEVDLLIEVLLFIQQDPGNRQEEVLTVSPFADSGAGKDSRWAKPSKNEVN